MGESRPDWQIIARVGERTGLGRPSFAPSLLFREIAETIPQYAGMDYRTLAWSEEQWPKVGGDDVYYGGTSYDNKSGLGEQWPVMAQLKPVPALEFHEVIEPERDGLALVPVVSLYDPGMMIRKSEVIESRIPTLLVHLHPDDAETYSIADGDEVPLSYNDTYIKARASVDGHTPHGVALLSGRPRIAGPVITKFALEESD
jgi:predicted molibdopterin-dependent oxidoreductase YjgC